MKVELHIDSESIDYMIKPENAEEKALNNIIGTKIFVVTCDPDGTIFISSASPLPEAPHE